MKRLPTKSDPIFDQKSRFFVKLSPGTRINALELSVFDGNWGNPSYRFRIYGHEEPNDNAFTQILLLPWPKIQVTKHLVSG